MGLESVLIDWILFAIRFWAGIFLIFFLFEVQVSAGKVTGSENLTKTHRQSFENNSYFLGCLASIYLRLIYEPIFSFFLCTANDLDKLFLSTLSTAAWLAHDGCWSGQKRTMVSRISIGRHVWLFSFQNVRRVLAKWYHQREHWSIRVQK